MQLVIGGPKHGELVNWDIKRGYYAVPGVYTSGVVFGDEPRTMYYQLKELTLFKYPVKIWLFERISIMDTDKIEQLVIPELLSYKAAKLLEDSLSFKMDHKNG